MLVGKQVRIRTFERADVEAVKSLNEDLAVRSNVVGWGWPASLTEMDAWFDEGSHASTHRWLVCDADERVIGLTGLWDVNWHDRNALTALKLGGRNPVRGRGLGTDAIKIVMAFAFYDVGLERLYSSILETNQASLRAYCDKCAWSVEGRSRKHVWRHGAFVDLLQVGILRSDFEQLPDWQDYRELVRAGATS